MVTGTAASWVGAVGCGFGALAATGGGRAQRVGVRACVHARACTLKRVCVARAFQHEQLGALRVDLNEVDLRTVERVLTSGRYYCREPTATAAS